jgi:hypothetical protein
MFTTCRLRHHNIPSGPRTVRPIGSDRPVAHFVHNTQPALVVDQSRCILIHQCAAQVAQRREGSVKLEPHKELNIEKAM